MNTQTEDYLPGAISLQALGYGLCPIPANIAEGRRQKSEN
jgi:hypothetical protein